MGYELVHKQPSYYDMMEVPPSASFIEIKNGYRRASLRVHPDKLKQQAPLSEEDEHCSLQV